VPGTAVYLNAHAQTTPLALRANVERNHVLHERVIIVSIKTERVPHVHHVNRLSFDELGHTSDGVSGLTLRCGFQDSLDVPAMLELAIERRVLERTVDLQSASYFLSQITIVPTRASGMSPWRKRLFLLLARNAATPVVYFRLPDERTVTVGERVAL